jgi:hypothetical protein
VDRIKAVGLAPVAGLLRNQAGGDDLAVEAIVFEAALQNISRATGLVATARSAMLAQSAEHAAHGVEVTRRRSI